MRRSIFTLLGTRLRAGLILLFTVLMISGCQSLVGTQTSAPVELPPATTPSPEMISTATSTALPTATRTPFPLIPTEEVAQTVASLLNDNGNCSSPCFWGFPLYTTDIGTLNGFLKSLHHSVDYASIDFENGDYYSFDFTADSNNLLTNVEVEGYRLAWSQGGNPSWDYYKPQNVIERFGVPDRVTFYFGYAPRAYYGYVINLYYADEKFSISYISVSKPSPYSPVICPFRDNEIDQFKSEIGSRYASVDTTGEGIDQVSSITLEEFAALAALDPEDACFEINPGVFYP